VKESAMKIFSSKKLQEALSDPRYSLRRLSKFIGLSSSLLQDYKAGKKVPSATSLFLVASALGKSVDSFGENVPDIEVQQQRLLIQKSRAYKKENDDSAQKVANV
jgi:transcriptional regulator with XRE-family HTH domain